MEKNVARRQLFEISLSQPVELCVLHYTAAFDSYRTTISFSIMQYIAFFARQAGSQLPPGRTPFCYTSTNVQTFVEKIVMYHCGDYINNHSCSLLAGESFRDFPNDEIGETDRISKND